MASVRKRAPQGPNGKTVWLVDYVDQAGKRRNKTFKMRKDAQAWRDRTVIEVADGVHTPPADSITVAEAGELWLAQGKTEGLEASTLRQYRQHLHLHINPFVGRVKLAELLPAHVQRLREQLIANGRSRDMAKRVVVSLGALLSSAMSYGKVAKNVVRDMARVRTSRDRRLEGRHDKRLEVGVDIPTREEIRSLLTAAQGRWRPLIVIAIFTGLRASELRGLTWNDVDLDGGTLTVRQRADRWNTIGSPKSEAGKRTVPLAEFAAHTLREWKLECPRSDGHLRFVFPNGKGNVESLLNIHRRGLGPLQHVAGITDVAAIKEQQPGLSDAAAIRVAKRRPKYGLHALRHAAASLFIAEGWSPKRVQAVMGHSSIQVTLDVYSHLFPEPEEDRAALKRLQMRLVGHDPH
jgi:integrase